VALAEEISRGLGRTADARELRHAMRRQVELEARLDDRGGNRVMAAAGAQRRDCAFVVAMREAELVGNKLGMMEFRLGDVGHGAGAFLRNGVTLAAISFFEIAAMMKRAVIGVPS